MYGGQENDPQRRDLEQYDRQDPCNGIKQIIGFYYKIRHVT